MSALTGWDYFIIVTAIVSSFVGIWRGLIRTVFGLAAWIGAFVAIPLAAPVLAVELGAGTPVWLVAIGVFLAAYVVVRLLGALVSRLVHATGLSGLDRGLGGIFGLARAAAIVAIAAVAGAALGFDKSSAWQGALSRPALDAVVEAVQPYLPERFSGMRRT